MCKICEMRVATINLNLKAVTYIEYHYCWDYK